MYALTFMHHLQIGNNLVLNCNKNYAEALKEKHVKLWKIYEKPKYVK